MCSFWHIKPGLAPGPRLLRGPDLFPIRRDFERTADPSIFPFRPVVVYRVCARPGTSNPVWHPGPGCMGAPTVFPMGTDCERRADPIMFLFGIIVDSSEWEWFMMSNPGRQVMPGRNRPPIYCRKTAIALLVGVMGAIELDRLVPLRVMSLYVKFQSDPMWGL